MGCGTALELGESMALAARRAPLFEEIAAKCQRLGGQVLAVPTDMTSVAAAQQLARQARGELLYFMDADTIHAPATAHAVAECMYHYQVQLLSAHPEYIYGRNPISRWYHS